jgi:hypothetical protein
MKVIRLGESGARISSHATLSSCLSVLEGLEHAGDALILEELDALEIQIYLQETGAFCVEIWDRSAAKKTGAIMARDRVVDLLGLVHSPLRLFQDALPNLDWHDSKLG